jgi:hypothetical protein
LPDGKMNKEAFIVYMMGYRMKMEQLAVSRFAMQKELLKHINPNPTVITTGIKQSQIKLNVASSNKLIKGEKHKLKLSLGFDKVNQNLRYTEYSSSTIWNYDSFKT